MGTISGILIVIIAFTLGNTLPRFTRVAFRLSMLARLSIVFLNIIMDGGMIGAEPDANFYYSNAVELSLNIVDISWNPISLLSIRGKDAFSNVHALIQWALGGESFFLAHAFSLFGAALCLVLISKIWLLLVPGQIKRLPYVLIIYSILPSVLTNQSYILREVWQSLCVFGIVWLSLSIQRYGYNVNRIIGLGIFAIVGCFLHVVMMIMIILILLLGLLLQNKISITHWYKRPSRMFKFIFILTLFLFISLPLIIKSGYYETIITEGHLENLQSLSEVAIGDARSDYGKIFDKEKPWTLLTSFGAYQTMPLPWRFGGIADFVLFMENMFRILMLLVYFYSRKKMFQFQKDNMDVIVVMWLIIEFIWSIGTSNWGTASRHHVPAVGLLLVAGLACYYHVTRKRLVRLRVSTSIQPNIVGFFNKQ
jgi:hypothetical protein